jgi:hypothetical protein
MTNGVGFLLIYGGLASTTAANTFFCILVGVVVSVQIGVHTTYK